MLRRRLIALSALTLLGCADPTAPQAIGQWGSNQASLTLSSTGGTLTLQCGIGSIDSAWTLTADGDFLATGGVATPKGGPTPVGGYPMTPARFTGRVSGDTFTLTVVVIETGATRGPYQMQRNGPAISQVCL